MFKSKKLLFILIIALITLTVVGLSACSTTDNNDSNEIESINIVTKPQQAYVLGDDIDLSEITLLVTYKNGEYKTVTVTDHMLSDADRELFLVKGTNTVYINYGGIKVPLQISVKSKDEIKNFTAEFKSNGGTYIESQTGTVINSFYVPTRPGYTFDGWYTNFELSGDKAKTPYTLSENVIFYAKWVDNRRYTVSFYDYYEVFIKSFEVVYGSAIDLVSGKDLPELEEIEGMVFDSWVVWKEEDEGHYVDVSNITSNVNIKADYMKKDCIVQIYTDADATGNPEPVRRKYGETFDINTYTLPSKEGHTSRWVYYINDETTHKELPLDGIIEVKNELITIKAYNVINTYKVEIENGEKNQTRENLKNGTIKNVPVYRQGTESYSVNYGANFFISNFKDTPNLEKPEEIYGYNAVWCLVIKNNLGEETWYNANNQIWSDSLQKFVNGDGGVKYNFDLLDSDGNIIAQIEGDSTKPGVLVNVKNIKANITIKPKYTKKQYTITLQRNENNSWRQIRTFTVPYLTDFMLYDHTMADYANNYDSAEAVERSYLYKNVATWLNGVDWNDVYWRTDSNLLDDWTIEWFRDNSLIASSAVNFKQTNGTLGSLEIEQDIYLYCKDTDQRRYNVVLYYDYDFTALPDAPIEQLYKKQKLYENLTENEAIALPTGYSNSIVKTYEHQGKVYNISYIFKGWYDFRYNDASGYTGNQQNPESSRNRNVYFYAHYECTTTYNLSIYDKTQKTAYDGRVGYENANYDVQEDTIFYKLDAGTVFNSATMLYKGKQELGIITSGQVFFDRYMFINYVEGELTNQYNDILNNYGGGDKQAAITKLNARIALLSSQISACELLWGRLYSYDYGSYDATSYQNDILTAYEYGQKQAQRRVYQDELELINNYDNNVILKNTYSQNMSDYKLYSDSIYTLNRAYDYSDNDIDNDNVKYKFLGWYLDENYATPYTSDINFEWFAAVSNLTLYAKWADQEKGTEGLVFQKVVIDSQIYLVVVDLLNSTGYTNSIYYGSGYNDLDNKDYSINLNDQGQVPINLGSNLDVQIPKEHGGDNSGGYEVIGILAKAFSKNAKSIKSIAMPATLRFIEDRAFDNCNIENFYISSSIYIDADDSRALYQTTSYVVLPQFMSTVGALAITGINALQGTLIAYANKSQKDYLTLLPSTTRIADGAFVGAFNLKYIDLGTSLLSVGNNAFEQTGIIGHYDTANLLGTDTFVLPDSLEQIGKFAFNNNVSINNISWTNNCNLRAVGEKAFNTTGWYNSQVGAVMLSHNLIGVKNGSDKDFERDINNQIIIVNNEARIKSGNNYLYFRQVNESFSLVRIEIHDAVVSVSAASFKDYYTVEEIKFYDCTLLENIFDSAFANCTNIDNLYLYNATSDLILGNSVFLNCPMPNVYVPNVENLHSSFDAYEYIINLINII